MFITKSQQFLAKNEALVLVHYDTQHYRPEFFGSLLIHFPRNIQKSGYGRQSEYLAGRLAAKLCLRRLGCKTLDVDRGESGLPHWPESMFGSISHTRSMAVSMVHTLESQYSFVGVDVEEVVNKEDVINLSSIIMHDGELRFLTSKHFSQEEIFTIIFSAKESAFKMISQFKTCSIDFHAFSFLSLDESRKQFSIYAKQTDCYIEGKFFVHRNNVLTVAYLCR